MIKKTFWILLVIMAILIGLYPFMYFIIDRNFGLLQTKSNYLLTNTFWNLGFYTHIILGGLALIIGWTQFSSKLRITRLKLHRQVGKVYVISALLSAMAGLYISLFATGGIIASLGFGCLGVIWFYITLMAYIHIKNKRVDVHQQLMVYSYAACFSAVTLRIWLPLLIILFQDFTKAYLWVAWLCWIPNLLVAFILVKKLQRHTATSSRVLEYHAENERR